VDSADSSGRDTRQKTLTENSVPTRDLGVATTPADVIRATAERFDDESGAGFIARELLRVGPASDPAGAARCGHILVEAGLLDEAEGLYLAMQRSFSRDPGGLVGLAQLAARRKNWPEALEHWDSVMKAFDEELNPSWLSERAIVWYELGHRQEATAIHADLLRDFPEQPQGYVGLAQLSLRERRWQEALVRYDEILARFGSHAAADGWRVMRASALLELGRAAEAEALVRNVVERAPGSVTALLLLLRVYASTGWPEVAMRVLNSSPFRQIETLPVVEQRLDILIRLKRFETWSEQIPRRVRASVEAGMMFTRRLALAGRPNELSSLFGFVPALYEGRERLRIWTVFLERCAAIRSSLDLPDRVRLGVLNARIRLALRDRRGVIEAMRDLTEHAHLGQHGEGEHGEALRRVAAVLRSPRYPDYSEPKLFGIGLSKTGTTTLAAALTLLGFHTLHGINPLTGEVISDDDLVIFDAFTDTPISARFESFYEQFPNSRFILTIRPFDDWVQSISRHWRRHLGTSDFGAIKAAMAEPKAFHYGIEFRNINRSLYFNFSSYREAFDAYEQRVRRFFQDKPADRFLELNIIGGDGWSKLCAFLGRDVPSVPFPWENRSSPLRP
jgi:tetratricopeptide (TPR) repeat protein